MQNKKLAIVTLVITAINFLGKFLGLIRSIILAALFGVGYQYDAFVIAFIIPSFMPSIIKNLIMTAFIPQFMKNIDKNISKKESWNGANTLFTVALIFTVIFVIVVILNIESLIDIIVPGIMPETKLVAVELVRIMMLATILMVLIAIFSSVAYCFDRFKAASLEPVTLNLVLLFLILFFWGEIEITLLAWSVVIGYFVQLIFQVYSIRYEIINYLRPRFSFKHQDFIEPLHHMLPLTVGLVSSWMMSIVDKNFASYLDQGVISALSYGEIIAFLPVEVLAASIMITFYPRVSREFISNNISALKQTYIYGMRSLVLIILPFIAIFMVYAEDLVSILFERGEFEQRSVLLTSGVLFYLSIGILARAIAYFNYRILHATKHPWLQVTIGLLGVVTNISLNAILIDPMGANGIALATSVSLIQSSLLSGYVVRKLFGFGLLKEMIKMTVESVVITGSILIISYIIYSIIIPISSGYGVTGKIMSLIGLPLSIIIVILVGKQQRHKELTFIYDLFASKLRRQV